MRISVLGYMGSGKSTVAKILASELNLKFIDLDTFIESEAGKTISQIFEEEKELGFRKRERKALHKLMDSEKDFVLALGGGTPVYYDNVDLINKKTSSFYLRLGPMDILNRVKDEKDQRPLLAHLDEDNLGEFIAKHLFDRRSYYEKAKWTIDVKEKNAQETAEEIIRLLHSS